MIFLCLFGSPPPFSLPAFIGARSILFVMSQADVFKAPHSDTYMVFGEAKIEDMSQTASAQVAEALTGGAGGMDAALAQARTHCVVSSLERVVVAGPPSCVTLHH